MASELSSAPAAPAAAAAPVVTTVEEQVPEPSNDSQANTNDRLPEQDAGLVYSGGRGDTGNANALVLSLLSVQEEEGFKINDQPLRVRAYGERDPSQFYLNCRDFKEALGLRTDNDLPTHIETKSAMVGESSVQVLAFEELVGTICYYKRSSPVAKALMDWINKLLYTASYGTAPVRAAMEEAIDAQFCAVSRQSRYLTIDYFNDGGKYATNYMVEAFTFLEFAAVYPEIARGLLPEGADPKAYIVIKYGCGKKGSRRLVEIRRDLRAILPGCDPRPMFIERFPGATLEDVTAYEDEWKIEFEDFNIKGIKKADGDAYTELFVMDQPTVEKARLQMTSISYRVNKERIKNANDAANEARRAVVAAEDVRDKAVAGAEHARDKAVADTENARDKAVADAENARDKAAHCVQYLEDKVRYAEERAQRLRKENSALKDALNLAPKKTAEMLSKLLQVHA
jgi:hypothetical protein